MKSMFSRNFDFHTHTVYSDGNGTVIAVVEAAEARGLEAVAITDHGPEHMYGTPRGRFKQMLQDIQLARENAGIQVLTGMEANVINASGSIDLDEELIRELDLLVVGIHELKGVHVDIAKAYLEAATKVIEHQKVDVFAHPFYFHDYLVPSLPLEDVEAFIKLAAERRVAMELNLKYRTPDRDFLRLCLSEGVKLSVGTDAHTVAEVGRIDWMLSMLDRVGAKREDLILDRFLR